MGTRFLPKRANRTYGNRCRWQEGGTLATTNELDGTEVDGFYIGRYEVTWSEWDEVRDWAVDNGYRNLTVPGEGCAANHPVHSTGTLFNVLKWCNAKSEKEGLAPVYTDDEGEVYRDGASSATAYQNLLANGYRLPLDAEWEFAARGGNESNDYIYAGSNDLDEVGWYWENSREATREIGYTDGRGTWPVGRKLPNALGLYDMSGNVLERCWDPQDGLARVRGGARRQGAEHGRVDFRDFVFPGEFVSNYAGLRLARSSRAETEDSGSGPGTITESFTVRSELFTLDLRQAEVATLRLDRESNEFPWASYVGQQLLVYSNRAWTVSTNQPWITLETIEGNGDDWIVYNVAANSDSSPRQAIITVAAGDMEASFTVAQQGAPAPATWYDEAEDLGNDWRWLPWLRSFNASQEPWIFHPQHGWLYPFSDDASAGIFFWDARQASFLYTTSGFYPTLYRYLR